MREFNGVPTPEMLVTKLLDGSHATGAGSAVTIDPDRLKYGKIPVQVWGTVIGDASLVSGSGLDDITMSGCFEYASDVTFSIKVSATSATYDVVQWKAGADATWVTGVLLGDALAISMGHGVTATFGTSAGHDDGDRWDIAATHNQQGTVEIEACIATPGENTSTLIPWRRISNGTFATADIRVLDLPYSYVRANITAYSSGNLFARILA